MRWFLYLFTDSTVEDFFQLSWYIGIILFLQCTMGMEGNAFIPTAQGEVLYIVRPAMSNTYSFLICEMKIRILHGVDSMTYI